MPRGGRRPGAGAPKGNLNGFKTGARSPRARRALQRILSDPRLLRVLAEAIEAPETAARRGATRTARPLSPALQAAIEEDAATQRRLRTIAGLRRVRAMLTRRLELDDQRRTSWHTILDQERARTAPNQSPCPEPASIQSNAREKPSLSVRRATRKRPENPYPEFGPGVLDDPNLWSDQP